MYTDRQKGVYLAYKIHSNRPNRLTHVVSNSNPLGSKRFDSEISISFKRKCNIMIIMQTQYTKNITDPGRFELDVTLSKPTRPVMLE